jgi:malate/lactate dehydrogenase
LVWHINLFSSIYWIRFDVREVPQGESSLNELVLELEDSEFKLVKEIIATTNPEIAFKNIEIAIFVGAFPRLKGMDRKELLSKNAGIFKVLYNINIGIRNCLK